ncbi:MAG: hypothetical protein IT209_04610 [Armatimonadetes bacterium]|nr:hypothetical protein [Armatimonadota bacterium]
MRVKKSPELKVPVSSDSEHATGVQRLATLLLGIWAGLAVVSWILVVVSLAGISIDTAALDRIGYIWLLVAVAGVARCVNGLVHHFRGDRA